MKEFEDISGCEPWERPWQRIDLIHRLPSPPFTCVCKSILIAIAKHESRKKGLCFASVETLRRNAGCSERSVQRSLRWLTLQQITVCEEWPGQTTSINLDWGRIQSLAATPKPARKERTRLTPLAEEGVTVSPPDDTGAPVPRNDDASCVTHLHPRGSIEGHYVGERDNIPTSPKNCSERVILLEENPVLSEEEQKRVMLEVRAKLAKACVL